MEIVRVGSAPVSPLAREEFVAMRDGIRLATDVYLPGGDDSPGDTILIRLPYDKAGDYCNIPAIAEYFMRSGYRVVAQDVRGKFRSEGDALLFINEAYDGYDTIEWIVHQRWSNGRVAMWGDSYYGYTQWAALSTQHPALKAIAPRVTGTQLGQPVIPHDDDVTRNVEGGGRYLYALQHFHGNDDVFFEMDWSRHPYVDQIEEFLSAVGSRSKSYDLWYPHPIYLPRFPVGHPFDARPIPVLFTLGWWDNTGPWAWSDVRELGKRPAWDTHLYLRIESMDHDNFRLDDAPDTLVEDRTAEQVEASLPRMLEPAIEFFDVFVRGNRTRAEIPRVFWELANTDLSFDSDEWPPRGAEPLIVRATMDGRLTAGEPGDVDHLTWVHDPTDLVPSSVSSPFSYLMFRPNEVPVGERPDVVVFDADPALHPTNLVGPVSASARVRSSGPNMDVFVRLIDVAPDGTGLRIARGQRFVVDATDWVEVEFDLGHLGYRLHPGHRLQLQIASSDFPEFLPQPGTGEDPWTARERVSNTQSIEIGGTHGLTLRLTTHRSVS